jgi:hypothetical protein
VLPEYTDDIIYGIKIGTWEELPRVILGCVEQR